MKDDDEKRFLTQAQVLYRTGYRSRSTIRRLCLQGRFPMAIKLPSGRLVWQAAVIADWQDNQPRQRP